MYYVLLERIAKAVRQAGYLPVAFDLHRSSRPEFGDFSSNVALVLAKQAQKKPMDVANELVLALAGEAKDFVASASQPGFVNFTCTPRFFQGVVDRWQADVPLLEDGFVPCSVNVELVSANPTGALHLGHARNGAVGDSLARIMAYVGDKVEREYYVNDGGNQIGLLVESVRVRCQELLTGTPGVIPEGGYHGEEIKKAAVAVLAKNEWKIPAADALRKLAIAFLLDAIKDDLLAFRVAIDSWFSEESLYANDAFLLKQTLAVLKDRGRTYELDGATFLMTTADGDDKDRVIVKSDGSYSYLLPDIAYHESKFKKGADLYVNVFGADHYSYISRLKSAVKAMGFDATKLHVITLQLVRMTKDGVEQKMSKRSGSAVGLRDLVEAVGVDAARWYMVDKSPNTHLEIDVAKALAKDASNPVFYVQYAYARCHQLLASFRGKKDVSLQDEQTVRPAGALLSQMALFDCTLLDVRKSLEPHRLTNYLYELAKTFHAFYAANKVIDETDPKGTNERLAVCSALASLIKKGLELVGVDAPERM